MRKINCFTVFVTLVLLLALSMAKVVYAEDHDSGIVSRLYLAFQVQESDLQSWLPEPWKVIPQTTGPSKGANLTIIFIQDLVTEPRESKPSPSSGMNRDVVLTIPAKNAATGEESVFVIRVYTTDPNNIPGSFKNSAKANIRREYSLKIENMEPGTSSDFWEMKEASGGIIKVKLAYKLSALTRTRWERIIRSSVDRVLSASLPISMDQIVIGCDGKIFSDSS